MTQSNESESSYNPNRLSEYAGLLSAISSLISEIELSEIGPHTIDTKSDKKPEKKPTELENTFNFEIIGTRNASNIPPKVSELLPDINQVVITLGQSNAKTPSYLSVDFISESGMITASRSGDPEDQPEFDSRINLSVDNISDDTVVPFAQPSRRSIIKNESESDFQDRITPINKIPQAQLNALIMSLVFNGDDKDYSVYQNVDMLDPNVFSNLVESLQLAAFNHSSSPMYTFTTSDTSFSYVQLEGQPASFSIRYPEEKTGRTITAYSSFETDFQTQFYTYDTTRYQLAATEGINLGSVLVDEKVPFYPTTQEASYLRTIVETEMRSIGSVVTSNEEATAIDLKTPDTIFDESGKGDLIFSPVYIQNRLDELDNKE